MFLRPKGLIFILFIIMGSKHPISLKLKKYKIWNNKLYLYNNFPIIEHKNLTKLINYYFQYVLISTPKISYQGAHRVTIKIYYTTINNSLNINSPSNLGSFTLVKFEKLLKKIYGQSVQFQLIRLKNPIFNANILAQFISINLKKYSVRKIWKILLKKFQLKNNIYMHKISTSKKITKSLNWMHILYNGLFCKEFYSNIVGLKLKISGRISKKRGASRTKVINYSIGTLNFNSINSSIDYGHIERKDKNGSQSIKVYANYSIGYLP